MICRVCHDFSDTPVCPKCRDLLERSSFHNRYRSRCPVCGQPVLHPGYPCLYCTEGILAYGKYAEPLRGLLERLKFQAEQNVASVLVPLYRTLLEPFGPVVLVPVPASRKGKGERGFDQTNLICKRLHRRYGYPVARLLVAKGRGEQKFLDSRQRKTRDGYALARNGARTAREFVGKGYTFFLVDDIATTGGTIASCRRLLEERYGVRARAVVLALA